MQPHTFLLISLLALFTKAQSIHFPSISFDVPSTPNPPPFDVSSDLSKGQSSSTSFSSSSSSFADGQGGSSISQISTTCNADAKCETRVNGTVVDVTSFVTSTVSRTAMSSSGGDSSQQQSEQTSTPVGSGGLLGGNADLAASGTVGSTVVVTGVPTETARPEQASSEASRGLDGMGKIMILTLGTVIVPFIL